jgi:o-succinylbenzoate synthase
VKFEAFELRRVVLPLVTPFRTAHGTERERAALLVRACAATVASGVEGWGECVAMSSPGYSDEHVGGATDVIRRRLAPMLLAGPGSVVAADVAERVSSVVGHPMAKAAVEAAVLDAELRDAGTNLADHLGAVRRRVPAGVAVGLQDTVEGVVEAVTAYLEAGYVRVKLKIAPGFDVEPVRAVREAFPDVALQVDANGAYRLADADRLAELDAFDLVLIEQPLPAADLDGHAALARRLRTPICLDESIGSAADAHAAIGAGACAVVCVKPGRVGGLFEAVRVHDVCVAAGIPVWCGGMLETGIGRAANVALAGLPGFTLPGDLSASDRYFARDLTPPFVLDDGHLAVPDGPGIGVEPSPEALRDLTTSVETIRA